MRMEKSEMISGEMLLLKKMIKIVEKKQIFIDLLLPEAILNERRFQYVVELILILEVLFRNLLMKMKMGFQTI